MNVYVVLTYLSLYIINKREYKYYDDTASYALHIGKYSGAQSFAMTLPLFTLKQINICCPNFSPLPYYWIVSKPVRLIVYSDLIFQIADKSQKMKV